MEEDPQRIPKKPTLRVKSKKTKKESLSKTVIRAEKIIYRGPIAAVGDGG